MILFCRQEKQTATNSVTAELTDKQKAGLQYIGGYVLQNLFKKHCRVNSDESQQAMAILKAGKVESGGKSWYQAWTEGDFGYLLCQQKRFVWWLKIISDNPL